MDIIRSYTELSALPTFRERFLYLRLDGSVGADTFGFDRYLNQAFYRSVEWKKARDFVLMRDNGCDLGIAGLVIRGKAIIHHINPITVDDIQNCTRFLLDPEFLICVSNETHNAIHYGDESYKPYELVERTPDDMCPWKR